MNYSKDIFVKDYFEIHKFYKNQYGNKVIILMQVGSFHECYGTNVDGLGEDLFKVGEYLNVLVTKKNKCEQINYHATCIYLILSSWPCSHLMDGDVLAQLLQMKT